MKILLVAATPFEIAPLHQFLEEFGGKNGANQYEINDLNLEILITGVGMMQTAFWLGKKLSIGQYDLAINAGVAGSFRQDFAIGDVVNVISERYGDLGTETAENTFMDIHEMELINGNEFPFFHSQLNHPLATETVFLPKAKGLTVNKVHGSANSIKQIKQKYQADIETMEGVAFFYACLLEKISFFEIRAISNYVEPRNKENWNIPLAINNLNKTLIDLLGSLQKD